MTGYRRLDTSMRRGSRTFSWLLILSIYLSTPLQAGDHAVVAVAANFLGTAQRLADDFAHHDGAAVRLVSGSSGQLYAQISQGAPYDVFLSADTARPQRLVDAGLAVGNAVTVYCRGLLALWLPQSAMQPTLQALQQLSGPIAIANPALAPYGAAAQSSLEQAALWSSLQSQLVLAQNVTAAHTMVASGNAQAGIVALTTVLASNIDASEYLTLPPPLAPTVEQGAVLLTDSVNNATAAAFFAYLRSSRAQDIISGDGYLVADDLYGSDP